MYPCKAVFYTLVVWLILHMALTCIRDLPEECGSKLFHTIGRAGNYLMFLYLG